jgi:hypothetical protein
MFMHPRQKYALKLRHVYAPRAEICPKSEAYLCTPGIDMPQVSGKILKF